MKNLPGLPCPVFPNLGNRRPLRTSPPTPFLPLASSIFLIFNDSFPTHSFQLRPHPFLYLIRIGQGLPQSTEGRRDEKPVWGGESTSGQQYEGKGQWTEDREPLGQEA